MVGFNDRRVLVTGGTRGIGRAIVNALAHAGARVVVHGETEADCVAVVADMPGATPLAADLAEAHAVERLADAVLTDGVPQHLFLNAGLAGRLRPGDAGYEDEVARLFAVNLHHARILCDRLLPAMAGTGGGSAVLTASLAGLRGNRAIGAYSLTKAALAQLARDMAVRWGPDGIRVNAVSPGLIATGWERAVLASPEATARRMQMTPLRRIGTPAEVAAAALFLASDAAGFITGHNLAVDGGTSITDGN